MKKKINKLLAVLFKEEKEIEKLFKEFKGVSYELKSNSEKSKAWYLFDNNVKSEELYLKVYEKACEGYNDTTYKMIVFEIPNLSDNVAKKLVEKTVSYYSDKINICHKEDEMFLNVDNVYYSNYENTIKFLNYLLSIYPVFQIEETKNSVYHSKYVKEEVITQNNANKRRQEYILKLFRQKPRYIALKDLPKNSEELSSFTYKHVIVKGKLIDNEFKATKKGFLYKMQISDYNESLYAVLFSRSEVNLNIGEDVNIEGVLINDDFKNDGTINLHVRNFSDIEFFGESELEEFVLSDNEFDKERTIVSLHSKMTDYDGLNDIEDYLKVCKNYNINALTLTDYMGCQNFPILYKNAKDYGIKAQYGIGFNVVLGNEADIYNGDEFKTLENIVAVDIETTGINVLTNEIIEIGAVKVIDKEIVSFNRLIKTDLLLTPEITKLTGITNIMLEEKGVDIKEALKEFLDFVGNRVIVGHNISFDIAHIKNAFKKYLDKDIDFNTLDTLKLARCSDLSLRSYSLDSVSNKLGLSDFNHHRATDDAYQAYLVYEKLLEKLYNNEVSKENINPDKKYNVTFSVLGKSKIEQVEKLFSDFGVLYEKEATSDSGKNFLYTFNYNGQFELLKLILNLEELKVKKLSILENNINYNMKANIINKFVTPHNIDVRKGIIMRVIAKNQKGLKVLYKMLSKALTRNLTKNGGYVLLSDLLKYKDDLVICSGNLIEKYLETGITKEFNTFLDASDYLELHNFDNYKSDLQEYEINIAKYEIIALLRHKSYKALYSDNVKYIYKSQKKYYEVLANTLLVGGKKHHLYGKKIPSLELKGSNEIMENLELDYELEHNEVLKMVFANNKEFTDSIEEIEIVPKGLFAPTDDFLDGRQDVTSKNIKSIKEEFETLVNLALKEYEHNGIIPKIILDRFNKEMDSIIKYKFYIMYYIAYMLVKKSNDDGYVVGSRGSVGSSFIAYLLKITEVNPLVPHYHCVNCKHTIFEGDFSKYENDFSRVSDGFDLPDRVCPVCGNKLIQDGHDIPFETFLGFEGDKTPDIDLNFSGDYQGKAHDYTKLLFGENYTFRAGTVGTVAFKTAQKMISDYYKSKGFVVSNSEIDREAKIIEGVKRTTGQHPGGIIVVPKTKEIYDFTPIQYPSNKVQDWFTTHLDYHSIDENLLKLDILGHDDPTMLKFLMDLVKEDEKLSKIIKSYKDIPVNDKKTIALLNEDTSGQINSLGISEFGTDFVKGMLKDIKPKTFSDLIKTSGLSHGTNVWEDNASSLIKGDTPYGVIPFSDVIGCRDDVMRFLISKGIEPKLAFDIMEFVRKGKTYKDKVKWQKYKEQLVLANIPPYFIYSTEKIAYLFPKAHATAYVMSAMRIAWFKAHYPILFYKAYFTIRSSKVNAKLVSENNIFAIDEEINRIGNMVNASATDKDEKLFLTVAKECIKMGIFFEAPNVNKSHFKNYLSEKNRIILPLSALDGVGEKMAEQVYNNRFDGYKSVEELKSRGKANKKFIESLEKFGEIKFN